VPNKYRQESAKGTRVVGGPEKPRKQSFMDRVRELAKNDKPENKAPKAAPVNPEGKKGSKLQEIQERANRIESE